jgi:uncharacterized protein YkwD
MNEKELSTAGSNTFRAFFLVETNFLSGIGSLIVADISQNSQIQFASEGTQATSIDASQVSQLVLSQTNALRTKQGLSDLQSDSQLATLALQHSEDVSEKLFFACDAGRTRSYSKSPTSMNQYTEMFWRCVL